MLASKQASRQGIAYRQKKERHHNQEWRRGMEEIDFAKQHHICHTRVFPQNAQHRRTFRKSYPMPFRDNAKTSILCCSTQQSRAQGTRDDQSGTDLRCQRSRTNKAVRYPPESLLLLRFSTSKVVKFPSSVGMGPSQPIHMVVEKSTPSYARSGRHGEGHGRQVIHGAMVKYRGSPRAASTLLLRRQCS